MSNYRGLSINIEVLEKMAAMAALETNGVVAMCPKRVDVTNALSRGSVLKPVHAEVKNGAVVINLYISIIKTGNAKAIAEETQASVKEKVQNMTGNAVTKVNVYVMDAVEEPTAEEN
ncbi:MAG: Asp23/Gls24 family envelope stress response protein [Clostridia bacterium]|nr:Asp23/Gls24 family envelope stress response protein [Clostridia bacterium]